jgi:hypothetical protein
MSTPLRALALAAALLAGPASATTYPDIAVQFTGPTELELGRPDRFKLTLTNLGSAEAVSVTATMVFPPGVELDRRYNTATGRMDLKVPAGCTYSTTPSKRLTCTGSRVAVNGDFRSFVVDLRAPTSGPAMGNFTWTASTAGDPNPSNNSATLVTQFGNFLPNLGLNFPATLYYWDSRGKTALLETPFPRTPGQWAVDANGDGSGSMGVPVVWKATKAGNNLRMRIDSAMYQPAMEGELTPLNSRCYQGLAYWTGLQASYEMRICY